MNLNDPFGRMAARQERDYASLSKSLKQAEITAPEQARDIQANLARRCRLALAVVLPIALAAAILLPEVRILVIALGALFTLWIVNATRKGQQFLERYIQEELGNGK
ncbi:hypothetical protein [Motiliproteus sp. SC1-56]|uniref:hypothetical protein n=1 Tax=Motiliproteus sp. SC1-56 TaxID=2799565 RepID=UPI001A8E0442|nr:hypothetical protein [Motiliproteus sp. SC1-56]